ncbi:MAG TPA: NADPH-dependent glutamate synthase [Actinobacteria bacterium]|nr:NADPH-dependent glutamate synthase [Actinomycetota bacterium]
MKKNNQRSIPKRVPMREQSAKERALNFNEVALGYGPEEAVAEASRCLQCKSAPCMRGCPVEVDIPSFVSLIAEGDFDAAIKKIKEKNCLPAICGRVCPQENQCEKFCTLSKKGEPLAIGRLEKFVADHERESGKISLPKKKGPTNKKVAVIGSGPAGLACAGDLAKLGHSVTIFEALHKSGGVLAYGIPEFRLPKTVVEKEIDFIKKLGAEIKTNIVIGKTKMIDELFSEGYDAVFLGTGAGLPRFLRVPGENLNGVYSANEFLTRANLMKAYLFPKYDTPIKRGENVVVVGGGNVAMDSARTALRLGAKNVYLLYRRTEEEMPARREEVQHAKEEGIKFRILATPKRFIGVDGWITAVECIKTRLGEPDESGRRKPVIKEGSDFLLPADVVIIAIGTMANPVLLEATPDIELNGKGYIAVKKNFRTSKEGVFAGGDITTGSATVILAIGTGKTAALEINNYLLT